MPEPRSIPGIGSVSLIPTPRLDVDLTGVALGPEDYFVLTRCDGKTPIGTVLQLTGLPEARALACLVHLIDVGAVHVPGVKPRSRVAQRVAAAPAFRVSMMEDCDLVPEECERIEAKLASLSSGSMFELLGVPPETGRRDRQRAFWAQSKLFHPDRFHGRQLGSYGAALAQIFDALREAYEFLDDDDRCEDYRTRVRDGRYVEPPLHSAPIPAVSLNLSPVRGERFGAESSAPRDRPTAPRPRSTVPPARVAELFERACHHEVTGELRLAVDEYLQVVRLDPKLRFVRRAAVAALKVGELALAEELSRRAVAIDLEDSNSRRVLARVLHERGRNSEALAELEEARRVDPANPFLDVEVLKIRSAIAVGGPETP